MDDLHVTIELGTLYHLSIARHQPCGENTEYSILCLVMQLSSFPVKNRRVFDPMLSLILTPIYYLALH